MATLPHLIRQPRSRRAQRRRRRRRMLLIALLGTVLVGAAYSLHH